MKSYDRIIEDLRDSLQVEPSNELRERIFKSAESVIESSSNLKRHRKMLGSILIAAVIVALCTGMVAAAARLLSMEKAFVSQYGINKENQERWEEIAQELATPVEEEVSDTNECGTITLKQVIRDGTSLYVALEYEPAEGIVLDRQGDEYLLTASVKEDYGFSEDNGYDEENDFLPPEKQPDFSEITVQGTWDTVPQDNKYPLYVDIRLGGYVLNNLKGKEITLNITDILLDKEYILIEWDENGVMGNYEDGTDVYPGVTWRSGEGEYWWKKFASDESLKIEDCYVANTSFERIRIAKGEWNIPIPLELEKDTFERNVTVCDLNVEVNLETLSEIMSEMTGKALFDKDSLEYLYKYEPIIKPFTVQSLEISTGLLWVEYFGEDYEMEEDGVDEYFRTKWKLADAAEEARDNEFIKEVNKRDIENMSVDEKEILRKSLGYDLNTLEAPEAAEMRLDFRDKMMIHGFMDAVAVRFKDGSIEKLGDIYDIFNFKEEAANLDGTASGFYRAVRPILADQIECIIIAGVEYPVKIVDKVKERTQSDMARLNEGANDKLWLSRQK